MKQTRWTADWASLHAALNLVREKHPDATEVTLETSDQGAYGFWLTGVTTPTTTIDEGGEWPQGLAYDVNDELSDVNWDSVVGESRTGHATIAVTTRRLFVIYQGSPLAVEATTTDLDEATEQFERLATGDVRVRLLELEVPTSWDDEFVARHAAEMSGWDHDGSGVRIVHDTALPIRLDSEADWLDAIMAVEEYVEENGLLDADTIEDLPEGTPRNARRAAHTLDMFRTYADAAGEGDEPLEAVLGDMLADLMHLASFMNPAAGHTFDSIAARARRRFEEEQA